MEATLLHEGNQVREFYSQLPGPVHVGIEATGSIRDVRLGTTYQDLHVIWELVIGLAGLLLCGCSKPWQRYRPCINCVRADDTVLWTDHC